MEPTPEVRPETLSDLALLAYAEERLGLRGIADATDTEPSTVEKTWKLTRRAIPKLKKKLLLSALGFTAHALQQPSSQRDMLPAPEGAVNDKTFMQVWSQVTTIWKHRKTKKKKQWAALVTNLDAFAEGLERETRRARRRVMQPSAPDKP